MSIDATVAAIEMNEKRLKVLVGQRQRINDQIAIVESSLNIFRAQLGQVEIPSTGSNVAPEKSSRK